MFPLRLFTFLFFFLTPRMHNDPDLSAWLGKTKTAGFRSVSAHISTLPFGERFSDSKLAALIRHHPGKTFPSPSHDSAVTFALRARPPYHTKALFVESRAGGFIDCSWKKCVANFFGKYSKEKTTRSRALNALRNEAFSSDKMKAARGALGSRCAECGKACRKLVVDHAGMPFAQIVDEYVADGGTTVQALPVCFVHGAYRLRSGGKAWQSFHDERAELVGLCAKCNMRLGSRGYRSARAVAGAACVHVLDTSNKPRNE
jgi:hypothetical protein